MPSAISWFLIAGSVLLVMALSATVLRRLPLTTAMLYLGLGVLLGPLGLGLLQVDLLRHAHYIEHLTEIAVLISLFSAGLKLRTPLADQRWHAPVRLATVSMLLTAGLCAFVGLAGLGLPVGAAVLLGAILAPTDPVLAADVLVEHPADRDRLRFSLTGEAGLNDGTAFPLVMLGLGLLGAHQLGWAGARWLGVDVVWAVAAGIAVGWGLGTALGYLVIFLRRRHREAVGLDDFLALGLIALSYGAALAIRAYGFLAVFAAGLALRHVELRASGPRPPVPVQVAALSAEAESMATDPQQAPAYMAQAVLGFTEQMERMAEVSVVLLCGALLHPSMASREVLWFVALLLLVIRPIAVTLGLVRARVSVPQRRLISWFGIRGIGSLYYLSYAVTHGLEAEVARRLAALTLGTITVSVVAHGISVTPAMKFYKNLIKRA